MAKGIIKPIALEELIFGQIVNFQQPSTGLIHIFGEAGSGKTILALQLAIGFCDNGKKVVFIDTEGKVTGSKIKDLAPNKDFSRINSLLKLHIPSNFNEQHSLICSLEHFLKNQELGLLIIDTITNLYRQEVNYGKNKKSNFEKLAFQVALLRKISSDCKFPVILFNQATMHKVDETDIIANLRREKVNPVAKAIMTYWTDREIILVSHGWGNYEARVPSEFKGRVKFRIDTKGIVPVE